MEELRDYQQAAVDYCTDFLRKATTGSRLLVAGPTGCGKSFVEVAVQDQTPDSWLLTPRLEIAKGILAKRGESFSIGACWEHRVVTPLRFLNALVRGDIPDVSCLLLDEGHHAIASTWDRVLALCGLCPAIAFTATPFRGTARATARFLQEWNEPVWMITLPQAAARRHVLVPRCDVLPLVDDDQITLASNGDFDVATVEESYGDRLDDLADACTRFVKDGLWDRPTLFALPSRDLVRRFVGCLASRGAVAREVTSDTTSEERDLTFRLLDSGAVAMCQISVVGEGVDYPFRRLVDAKPTMSPVAWMQQVGRITRPGDADPEYYATNRNLSRHAYLFEGLLPGRVVAESDAAFGKPSTRLGYRALGLEEIGRFTPASITTRSGTTAVFYSLNDVSGGRMREYACFVHPTAADPVWAERRHTADEHGAKKFGRWARCEPPADLRGFASVQPKALSDKMQSWWDRSAATRGLDPSQEVNRKNFGVLPFLFDLNLVLKE